MTNVTIQGKELGAALVYQAEKCRFPISQYPENDNRWCRNCR